MKLIVNTLFVFFTGLASVNAQQNNNQAPTNQTPKVSKAVQDSLATDKKNGTIYSKVNKDGVIEITRKEFDKIPVERQDAILKDKNYKIIEEK